MPGHGTFRARLMGARELEGEQGQREGTADVMVAVFGVPDTNVAVGNSERQVIDKGAFREFIDGRDFAKSPVPLYLDHGDAHVNGFTTSLKKLGYADNFRETDEGLVYTAHYNLDKQIAREAYSDLQFDPFGTQFSFRWPPDEKLREGDDGFEHVVRFSDVIEVSQVAFGAQENTGVMAAAAGMRSGEDPSERAAIRSHSTATYDGTWDGPAMVGRLGDDAPPGELRKMFAYVDGEADPATKGAYKFPHHTVAGGDVGAANVSACRAGIAILNGGRGGANISASDRAGVYAHLASHLRDADVDVPQLRATPEEVLEWLKADSEYSEAMLEGIDEILERSYSLDGLKRHMTQKHGKKVPDGTRDLNTLRKQHSSLHESDDVDHEGERMGEEDDDKMEQIRPNDMKTDTKTEVEEEKPEEDDGKSRAPDKDTVSEWLKDENFRKLVAEVLESMAEAEPAARAIEEIDGETFVSAHTTSLNADTSGMTFSYNTYPKVTVTSNSASGNYTLPTWTVTRSADQVLADDPDAVKTYLRSTEFMKLLAEDEELHTAVRTSVDEALAPDPVAAFYRGVFDK